MAGDENGVWLPELPEPEGTMKWTRSAGVCINQEPGYTAEQMREYALQARENGERNAAPTPEDGLEDAVEYEFQVWQDDTVQAVGGASTLAETIAEANHYAMMYGQDGPVVVRYYERRDITAAIAQAEHWWGLLPWRRKRYRQRSEIV